MNKKKLFTSLNELCRKLDDTYCINCGGCCFVAAVIVEQLELHNIPYSVIHYDISGCHYAIRVSDRIINRSDYRKCEIYEEYYPTSKDLYNNYYNNNWNMTYDSSNNSIVKRKIKALFNGNSIRRRSTHSSS